MPILKYYTYSSNCTVSPAEDSCFCAGMALQASLTLLFGVVFYIVSWGGTWFYSFVTEMCGDFDEVYDLNMLAWTVEISLQCSKKDLTHLILMYFY